MRKKGAGRNNLDFKPQKRQEKTKDKKYFCGLLFLFTSWLLRGVVKRRLGVVRSISTINQCIKNLSHIKTNKN